MSRIASIERVTNETRIRLELGVDGSGKASICTSVPFLDHMLNLFARHGLFDLEVEASGDIDIDFHHTVEDIGIVLGEAFKQALGEKKGIRRYGQATVPMDETLASVAIDISGRPYLVYHVALPKVKIGEFDVELARKHFKCNGRFYQCQSEFIFFKKTARNKAFFAKVKELFVFGKRSTIH